MQTHFDYIIAGCGAAGFSLLMRMRQEPFFAVKTILVIDNDAKDKNDRTWCFWQKDADIFESIVFKKWNLLKVKTNTYERIENIAPYQYKMIRGIDFYNHCKKVLSTCPNIIWVTDKIVAMESREHGVTVDTTTQHFSCEYVFNSTGVKLDHLAKNSNFLMQHFKGWVIETKQPAFDATVATYMDFDIDQMHGTSFVYVMPFSANKALVEYTLFTPHLITDEQYNEGLNSYIKNNLNISDFEIVEEEKNIIPMSDFDFPKNEDEIINIGIAGGTTRGSSGYTFSFIQKQTKAIVNQLRHNLHPAEYKPIMSTKAKFYDRVLLEVLLYSKLQGRDVFSNMFKKQKITTYLPFLDDESSLLNDFKVIFAQPVLPFVKAVFKIR